MKKIFVAALAAGAALVVATPALASDGCGRGAHRGPAGHCRADRGRHVVAVAPGRLVVGNFYGGRGYWDGNRYWKQRYRHGNGWRYR
jgi:hypothetical protein